MPSGAEKLASLRNLMKNVTIKNNKKGIQAYIVTSNHAHMTEYVPARDKRREFISGFKGSSGTVVVTQDKALLWTDGRYFAQALREFDPPSAWTLMKDGLSDTISIEKWIHSLDRQCDCQPDKNSSRQNLSTLFTHTKQSDRRSVGQGSVCTFVEQNCLPKVDSLW